MSGQPFCSRGYACVSHLTDAQAVLCLAITTLAVLVLLVMLWHAAGRRRRFAQRRVYHVADRHRITSVEPSADPLLCRWCHEPIAVYFRLGDPSRRPIYRDEHRSRWCHGESTRMHSL